MSKLWKKHQKFLKGDAGFSLVELIIVIAIMAALIAVLAPQYMKYVDKSRKAADAATADEIFTACKVAATEESINAEFTATWNGSTLVIDGTDATDAAAILGPALGLTFSGGSTALVAKYKGTTSPNYVVTYTPGSGTTEGTVKVTNSGWFGS